MKRVVYETVKQSLKNCYDLLQLSMALMQSTSPPDPTLSWFDVDSAVRYIYIYIRVASRTGY